MTKIAIDVSEKENRQLKLLSMERNISSKALLIQRIVSEYLQRLNTEKGIQLVNKNEMK